VKLLLVKQLVGESNRMFTNMFDIFSMLSGIDVSYKTIERLSSDEEAIMALHNLHILLLKKKGIQKSDTTGDGTGYSLSRSLTISKHYESIAKELREKSNARTEEDESKRQAFAYTFRLTHGSFVMDVHCMGFKLEIGEEGCVRKANENALRVFT
jgi:transposase